MELTPVQRIVTFTVVVLVLAGLGAYLFLPKSNDGAAAAGRPKPAGQPTQSAQPTTTPTASPASSPPGSGKAPDIYSWLPFTESGLGSAAQVTTTFADDYGTFSYQESTSAYLAPMKPLMTSALEAIVGRAFATPGVAAQRVKSQQTATATATITSLRAFGPTSLTFVVNLVQHLKGTKGPSEQNDNYAITVTGSGSNWQVSDIEFASAGNQ
ncbi:MAG TPA: hypothetical protein VFI65_12320 [Streptosporangiaceae bacterium]|nr:hypothetical protein [Streptosporangiaceae bacterium]